MNIGFDIDSYVMGKKGSGENIVISGDTIICTDLNNDGNVVISVNESEVNNNG